MQIWINVGWWKGRKVEGGYSVSVHRRCTVHRPYYEIFFVVDVYFSLIVYGYNGNFTLKPIPIHYSYRWGNYSKNKKNEYD